MVGLKYSKKDEGIISLLFRHFIFFQSTRYATASKPPIAERASKPGVGVSSPAGGTSSDSTSSAAGFSSTGGFSVAGGISATPSRSRIRPSGGI